MVGSTLNIMTFPSKLCFRCQENYLLQLFQKNDKNLKSKFLVFVLFDRKSQKIFFLPICSVKTKFLIILLKNNCSQLSFEVHYVFLVSKLKIFAFQDRFFYAWTSATFVTYRGPNFNLSNLNRVSNLKKRPQLSYEILFVGLE